MFIVYITASLTASFDNLSDMLNYLEKHHD